MAERLIIYGGAFDPPHRAHVELPQHVREKLAADAVIYVPVGVPPHRPATLTPAPHRLRMLKLALQGAPATGIDTIELDRAEAGRPTYTVDTLEAMRRRHPSAELRLLIGGDQMLAFHTWKNPQRIIELAEPVVMARGEIAPPDPSWAHRLVDTPRIDVSASDLRRRLREGEPVTDLLHPDVERYIHDHDLYRP